jgi:iron complex outermembrane recepter protein
MHVSAQRRTAASAIRKLSMPFSRLLSSLVLTAAAVHGQNVSPPEPPRAHTHADEPVHLDNVVVSATPFKRDQAELAAATNVLAGRSLLLKQQSSLGATLADEPGIASTYFGPGASRPIIRGFGGDRVRVLTNGVGTLDASVTSPDHAVSTEPMLAERIEVVRGPATLLYGSNAVGGVVNVFDGRIPSEAAAHPLAGRVELRGGTVARERAGVGVFEGGAGRVAWRVDGLSRETDDVRIPGFANPDNSANHGRLTNSATETTSFGGGVSFVGERGFVGGAASRYDTAYGVVAEPDVTIELTQNRLDLEGEHTRPSGVFSGVRGKLGFADYEHTEFEGAEVGTRFENRGFEGRAELLHEKLGGRLNGAWGVQVSRSDFSAIGEEAFLPPSLTNNYAVFAFEELPVAPFAFQFGARVERQKISTETGSSRRDTVLSASGGIVYANARGGVAAFSLAHTERAPNAQELFSNGPHAGTNAFEIGDPALGKEKSLGLDLSLRQRTGFVTGAVSLFANQFDGFVFESFTGAQDPDEGLDIYAYAQRDARFHGGELEAIFHLHDTRAHSLDLRVTADTVRAKLRDTGENLPRITPRRFTVALDYRGEVFTSAIAFQAVGRARHLGERETPTASYGLLHASIGYCVVKGGVTWEIFLRGTNLTDKEARNHVSFLKDIAPLAGRDMTLGVRTSF